MKDAIVGLTSTVIAGIAGGAARIASQYKPGASLDIIHIICGLLVAGFTAYMAEAVVCSLYDPSDTMLTFIDGMSGFAANSILNVLTDVALAIVGGKRT